MATSSQVLSHDDYSAIPMPTDTTYLSRADGIVGSVSQHDSFMAVNSLGPSDYGATPGALLDPSPLAHSTHFHEDFDGSQRGSSVLDGISRESLQRSDSQVSQPSMAAPRGGTLKKKASLSRKGSLKRSSSRRSLRAGSVRSLNLGEKEKYGSEDTNSAFYVPIPTSGSPTEVLASRFQAWRKLLKDLIIFFKDVQKSYEVRAKLLLSTSHLINGMSPPRTFLETGGLADTTKILRDSYKQAIAEANKAKEVENEVILQLTGLRSDLHQKIKEIKGLSGDFKNTVEREVEGTRKAVRNLQETLGLVDVDPSATSGKHDPFIMRLSVDRQLEKQIEEENYLHRAYLNLESSGRELESIVVGEIQKAYNVYASVLKREADVAYDTVEKLRVGPISIPKDHEWNHFLAENDQLVDPRVVIRDVEHITYPGKDHPAAVEVRSGMLERKSKYLKSYTPGWYVLSPTHLHEFKSADRIAYQTPLMSLYLPEQKLGSHSQPDSSSHKFMLKGRQTGAMHRGHSWVFRAESHETMMTWYEDIAGLIGKTGEARNAFVQRHMRSVSGGSWRANSVSSDGVMDEDEADRTPYLGDYPTLNRAPSMIAGTSASRPQPGGRFPSDIQIDRHLHADLSRSSGESSGDREALVEAGMLPGVGAPFTPAAEPAPGHETDRLPDTVHPAKAEKHDAIHSDWTGNNNHAPRPQQEAATQHDQQKGTGSKNSAVAVLTPSENPENFSSTATERESAPAAPASTSHTRLPNKPSLTPIDAGENMAKLAPNVGQLRRPESQGSKHSQSSISLPASSTASSVTSPSSTKVSVVTGANS